MPTGMHRPGHGRRWDAQADADLRERVAQGQFLPEIARAMGRTQEAVRSRANLLKVRVRSSAVRGGISEMRPSARR